MSDSEATYIIRTEDGTGTEMGYDEVVQCVGVAISYRLGKAMALSVEGKIISAAAEAATHWLSASLTRAQT